MPIDVANFAARNFGIGPNLAAIDQARSQNALLQNQVQQIPMTNALARQRLDAGNQELAIQKQQADQSAQTFTAQQQANARGVLATSLKAIAEAPDPKAAASDIVSRQDFQSAAKFLGLPAERFAITDQLDPNVLRQSAANMAKAFEPSIAGNVQSTQIDPQGNLLIVTRDGRVVNTGKPVADRYSSTEIGGAKGAISSRTGTFSPISTPAQEQGNVRDKAAAEAVGKGAGEATVALPDALFDINNMRNNVNNLLTKPGFDTIYGLSGAVDPRNYIPGTDASNANAARNQIDAQAFSVVIQKMRGLGSLSNAEGSKVTSAFTRATNPKISAEEARSAWGEVLDYLDLAEARAKRKAAGAFTSPPATPPASVKRIKVDAEGNVIGN